MPSRFDVVIPCGPDRPDTLRWSLRTIWHNFPYARVFLVGRIPVWVTNVITLPVEQNGRRFDNQRRNILAVLDSDVDEDFYWWDDDHFLLEQRASIPFYHDTLLSQWLKNKETTFTKSGHHAMGEYHQAFQACMDLLNLLGYEDGLIPTHTPMRINVRQLEQMKSLIDLSSAGDPKIAREFNKVWAVWKAFYLSLIVGANKSPHMKDPRWRPGELTMDGYWAANKGSWTGDGGKWIKDHFWRPSPFEALSTKAS